MGTGFDQRHLRPVLEFALALAREIKPPAIVPAGLKPYLKMKRVPSGQLGALGRAVAGDARFAGALAEAARLDEVAEAIGEFGVIWLTRPDGWEARLAELAAAADAAAAEAGLQARLDKATKQRERAEAARAHAVAELASLRLQIAAARDELAERQREVTRWVAAHAELQTDLQDVRKELRAATQRADAAKARADELRAELEASRAIALEPALPADRQQALTDLAKASSELADRLADLERELVDPTLPSGGRRRDKRVPLVRPGGVRAGTGEEAAFLLRSGAVVLIDGYNVAMQAWPKLDLANQRERMISHAEDVARRFGADVTVVFDGAEVAGASTTARRLTRVLYSPPDVIADDVIRSEVGRIPASRAVVVVTDDREILRDVKARGANTIGSMGFARETL